MPVPPSESAHNLGTAPRQPSLFPEQRAEPPRPPTPSRTLLRAQEEQAVHLHSVLRGLVLLAIAVLVFSLVRAGMGRAFFTGWWRQW